MLNLEELWRATPPRRGGTLHIIYRDTPHQPYVVCHNFNGVDWDHGTYCDTLEAAANTIAKKLADGGFISEPIALPLVDDGAFGSCPKCGYEMNSELIEEYHIKHCPECGQRVDVHALPDDDAERKEVLTCVRLAFARSTSTLLRIGANTAKPLSPILPRQASGQCEG